MEPMQDMEMELDLRHYWAVLRRWMYLIIGTTLLAGIAAFIVSVNMSPVYKATTQVRIQQASSPSGVDTYSDLVASERLARTYAKLIVARPVLEETIKELGLEGVIDANALKGAVSVTPVRDTSLLEISVEHEDPALAVRIANKIPEVFARQNESLQRSRFAESKRNLQSQLKTLADDLAQAQKQLATLRNTDNADPGEIARLEALVTSLQASYANLLRQFEEIRLAEAQAVDTIVISEPAVEAHKVRPRVLMNTLLAAVVGLMLGMGGAFLMEYLDDTVKAPDEVERKYGVPVLAGIPEMSAEQRANSPGLIVHEEPTSPVAEAFRVLRTNVQFASVDTDAQTLMITSPEPVEGKSFVTANLAIAMSQMDRRVLLVDADLRKPRQHEIFQVPNSVGLTTALLASNEDVHMHIQETRVPNVSLLTSGPKPPNPAELLGSQRMQELIHFLAEQWDVVIFDTPPILAATDAIVLATRVNGVLLVCRAGETYYPALEHSLQELRRVEAHLLGVIMNALPVKREGYYYRYYPYRYEYYAEDGKKPRQRRREPRSPLEALRRAIERR